MERAAEARRVALAPYRTQIAEAERDAALGGPEATAQLRAIARQLRLVAEELYAEARRREGTR